MMSMLPFSPPPSVANAYARVDKATSEFLSCPDWRINIGVCDTINFKPWLAKDYIKAVRGRLQHKNPNIQLLSLTVC
uniref:TOM1-like protein 6 n=1 Tax=Tanacetum cinerariifolium TaxID=118510 RepID=A0A699QAD9_TANCI|nr:TOM1-like protein 6 [Tanacetum cinerariifolium]